MKKLMLSGILAILCWQAVYSQTTSFSHQGKLNVSGAPANGNFDFEFKLFDAASGGAQVGSTQQKLNVVVANGIYSVSLDFGAAALPGADRFLDISVRTAGGGVFTPLAPRQQITSTPYAVRSLSAATADSVGVGGVPSGSGNYIQNTTSPQAASNFNISGNGTADGTLSGNIVNATTQYNIGGGRILSNLVDNLFVGLNSGAATPSTSFGNSFVGHNAGPSNTSGVFNSFFGRDAGLGNTTGSNNSFFGRAAGFNNTLGSSNSFFGGGAGLSNTTGNDNTVVGFGADVQTGNLTNATAIGSLARVDASNSLVLGSINGVNGATASTNIGIGTSTPSQRLHVVGNSVFAGNVAISGTLTATLPGGSASYIQNGTTQQASSNFNISGNGVVGGNIGIGTSTPSQRLHVVGNSLFGGNGLFTGNVGIGTTTPGYKLHVVGETLRVEGNTTGTFPRYSLNFTGGGADAKKWQNYATTNTLVFSALNDAENSESMWMQVNRGTGTTISNVQFLSNVGIGVASSPDMLAVGGTVSISFLGSAGAQALCRNFSNQISTCSSSLRYKSNISRFSAGMLLVNQLRPISFDWKDGGMRDVGFGAEDIAKIDPRFVTYNSAGEIEGVKYDRLSVAFVNAFKEQQAEISELRAVSSEQAKKIEDQQKQIDALKEVVCKQSPTAAACKK